MYFESWVGGEELTTMFAHPDDDPLPEGVRHFSREGYRAFAEVVYERLDKDGVLDWLTAGAGR